MPLPPEPAPPEPTPPVPALPSVDEPWPLPPHPIAALKMNERNRPLSCLVIIDSPEALT